MLHLKLEQTEIGSYSLVLRANTICYLPAALLGLKANQIISLSLSGL